MKLSRITRFFTLLLLLVTSACSAAPAAVTGGEISLQDGLGREVILENPADRIVSLSPSVTEILFAVGAGSQVVGRDSFSNYPAEAASIQDVGGSMGSYSLETIASLEPDLVIAAEINTPEQVSALEGLGLKVYYLSNPTDLEGIYSMLQTVGTLSGHANEAMALSNSLRERVQLVQQTIKTARTKPLVFYELDGTEPAKPWTPGPGSFMDILINEAGGRNAAAGLQSQWAQISIEELLVQNPDIILLGDSIYGMTPEQVADRAGWDGLTAVQQNHIYP
ncbi:MAG TPA: ABC transporter substrate-binding protein, partial [Anaerolineaceae bacterium]|nr:ABC transporter substrate-binding protein [Anaerolineaceae bacterium]